MYFKPHILQKKVVTDTEDSYGRIVTHDETWETVCPCRCDDSSTQEVISDNGTAYRPKYHVVCEGRIGVRSGDFIRCLDSSGNTRCEGKAVMDSRTNWFSFTELWI